MGCNYNNVVQNCPEPQDSWRKNGVKKPPCSFAEKRGQQTCFGLNCPKYRNFLRKSWRKNRQHFFTLNKP